MSRLSDVSGAVRMLSRHPDWGGVLDVFRAASGRRLSYQQPLDDADIDKQVQLLRQAAEQLCAEALKNKSWPPAEFRELFYNSSEPPSTDPARIISAVELGESGKTGRYQARIYFEGGAGYSLLLNISRTNRIKSVAEARGRIAKNPRTLL